MESCFYTLWQRTSSLCHHPNEHVVALYVDRHYGELATCVLGSGTRDACTVHPRDVFRIAVQIHAFAVVLGHTHPSGSLTPSSEDITATQILHKAARLLCIPLLGHAIITRAGWHVIRENQEITVEKMSY